MSETKRSKSAQPRGLLLARNFWIEKSPHECDKLRATSFTPHLGHFQSAGVCDCDGRFRADDVRVADLRVAMVSPSARRVDSNRASRGLLWFGSLPPLLLGWHGPSQCVIIQRLVS